MATTFEPVAGEQGQDRSRNLIMNMGPQHPAFYWRGSLRGAAARPAFARVALGAPEPQAGAALEGCC
ncbi:MAG: hypothetical protein EPN33_01610 [Acidobacteria bacterium]|nr:MAG: hypothetical protein EPN33_01610 [Acidobacteriota bacterium]